MLKIKREKLNGLSCCNIIRERFLNVICGHRPANLDCRITSGNDYRVVQCGRSMIEMLGVLAIIGVLSVAGIAGYSKAMTKFKTNKVIDEVMTIANNIKTLYANQKNYASLNDLNDIDLKTFGIVPAEMYDENGEIKNAFNGEVIISAAWYDGTHLNDDSDEEYNAELRAYSIAIRHIPEDACMELATQSWQNYFGAITIGSNVAKDLMYNSINFLDCLGGTAEHFKKGLGTACAKDNQIPISPDKAALACDCSASDHLCDFVFTGK